MIMKFMNERNISKGIIILFIAIMSLMIMGVSYIYIKKRYSKFDEEIKTLMTENYNRQRELLKREVDIIIDILNHRERTSSKSEDELKQDAIDMIHNISFQKSKSDYFFVYEVHDFKGGEAFARLVVNPNRPDLVGKFISTYYKDLNGKQFRKEFLSKINEKGDAYTHYVYKKPYKQSIEKKLSYFKVYEKWDWIIATGIYLDDLDAVLTQKRQQLEDDVFKEVVQTLIFFVLCLSVAIVGSYFLSRRLEEYFDTYKMKIQREVEKNREKDKIIFQQSKLAALGELLGIIAHQWRHPLAKINSNTLRMMRSLLQNEQLSNDEIKQIVRNIEQSTKFLSLTITDFMEFFSPDKKEIEFSVFEAINECINIIFPTKSYQIEIDIQEKDKNVKTNGYKSLYQQVIVTILVNAIEQFEIKNIYKPRLSIVIFQEKSYSKIIIEDNANGIDEKILPTIFEPYVSSKQSSSHSKNMGLGLYIAKIIITQNDHGSIHVENTSDGARFTIIF